MDKLPSQQELNTIWRGLHPELPDFNFKWSAKRTFTAGTIFHEKRLIRLSVKHYLEFGIGEMILTLKHEAAHYLAWSKHKEKGHGEWLWYYLGYFQTTRHCKTLSADMKAKRIRLKPIRQKRRVEYDPISKTFKEVYE